jgi:hypothetical protein
MQLMVKDIRALQFAINELSVLVKKLPPFIKVAMIVLTAILIGLCLFQMLIYLALGYFECHH